MSAVKKIKKASILILGCEAEPWDNIWTRVKDLSEVYGSGQVAAAFEEWAEGHKNAVVRKPVEEFLQCAHALLRGQITFKANPEATTMIDELESIANDVRVIFTSEQRTQLGRLLTDHRVADIVSVFREYWSAIESDPFMVNRATRDFTDKAESLLRLQRRRRTEAEQQAQMIERLKVREADKASKELEESAKRRSEEESLVEDNLQP